MLRRLAGPWAVAAIETCSVAERPHVSETASPTLLLGSVPPVFFLLGLDLCWKKEKKGGALINAPDLADTPPVHSPVPFFPCRRRFVERRRRFLRRALLSATSIHPDQERSPY
ncbi:hypothetical protein U9M48_022856 [Paspalum notatum var. saurae]|uniref:Uncharacterized protein n=1 Tax=Paspalum notatum var. saurae TaxID=547442 RepID=A0AAQ3TP07_PASNO